MHAFFDLRDLTDLPWWILGFWILGIVAVSTAIVSLFFALGRRPGKAWASEVPPVASRDFLVGISGLVNSPLEAGAREAPERRSRLLPASLRRCARRGRTINSPVHLGAGKAATWCSQVINRTRARRRSRCVCCWGRAGMAAPSEGFEASRRAGGAGADSGPSPRGIHAIPSRNHRAIVIDGACRFHRGGPVGDKWLERRQQGEWRTHWCR